MTIDYFIYHFSSSVSLSPAEVSPGAGWVHADGRSETASGPRQVPLVQHVDEASQDVGRGERALELHGRLKVTKSFIIATCIMKIQY